jgi:hypothetical protein
MDMEGLAGALAQHLSQRKRSAEALAIVQREWADSNFPFKVLHLVGLPLQARTEQLWQVTSAAESEAIYTAKGDIETEQTGFLISVDDIPVGATGLIILQEEPATGFGWRRTDLDRERAGALRSFAYGLLQSGALAVLTIPALPDVVAPNVMGAVALALEGDALPDVARLLAAAGAARRQISSAVMESEFPIEAEESSLLEAALDVCVFVRSERVPDLDSEARVPKQEHVQGSIRGLQIGKL